jgi:hypothetical protein
VVKDPEQDVQSNCLKHGKHSPFIAVKIFVHEAVLFHGYSAPDKGACRGRFSSVERDDGFTDLQRRLSRRFCTGWHPRLVCVWERNRRAVDERRQSGSCEDRSVGLYIVEDKSASDL